MKIFQGFLIVVVSAILWMLPVTQGIYDFRTDIREAEYSITVGAGITTADVVLSKELYDEDTDPITFASTLNTDSPVTGAYVAATRTLTINGLDDDATRTMTVSYPYDALETNPAISTVMDFIPMIWILILVAFPVVGLLVIWLRR